MIVRFIHGKTASCRMLRKLFAIGIILSALHFEVSAQTVDNFVNSAIRKHPDVKAARAALRAEKETLVQARANYLPSASLDASISSAKRDARLTAGSDFEDHSNPSSTTVTLNQTLYAGGLRTALSGRANLQVRIAEAQYQSIELNLAGEVLTAYFDLWLAQQQLKAEIEYERLVYEQYQAAEALFDNGVGTATEVSLVKARVAETNARFAAAQFRVQSKLAQLKLISGLDITDEISLPDVPSIPMGDQEGWEHKIIAFSPELRRNELEERLERINAVASNRQNRPQVSLQFQASSARSPSPAIEQDDDYRASLNFSMPLYDGGRANSQTRAALASKERVRQEGYSLRLQIIDGFQSRFLDLQTTELEIIANEERVTASEAALIGIEEGKAAGLWTTQDTLEATERLILARIALIEAEYRRSLLISQLYLQAGRFDDLVFD